METKKEIGIQTFGEPSQAGTIGDPVSVEDENGRTWQNYKPDKYFLPNDAGEQDRLDVTHKGFCIQVHSLQDPQTRSKNPDDALHLAPIEGDPPRVLDLGTGTGIWAIEYARRHPGSEVIGSDLSLIQPDVSATVPNVSFVREDVEDYWVHGAPFDFIHGRLLFTCFDNHKDVIKKAFDSLRPGGWIEYQDSSLNVDSDDNSHRRTALHKLTYLSMAGAAAMGRDLEVARKYKDYFIEAGFVDVVEVKFKVFGNTWPEKEPDCTIGKYMSLSGSQVIKTISEKLLRKGLVLPEDIIEPIVLQALKDVNNTQIHLWWPGYVVYGRKPFDHEKS
ncbi:uncharacterized protein JN550_005569 [Neoarthrinium moseri]|uniref:uncharacterized protein n=1 Tax=Neoarthrinium moseri TaxID=1658444 RepID=UPI001FDC6EAD|nr:uncharacterized protein JN550_005569 [Neoarthrinium moseri]KAI1869979.1 hypothetical protein JN550_005569 [Neoarthrinium moseri]